MTTTNEPTVAVALPPGLPPSRTRVPGVYEHCNCHASSSVWYYDMALAPYAPPSVYAFLLSQAKSSLWCWDPYLTRSGADLFSGISRGTSIQIHVLTGKGLANGKPPKSLADFRAELARLCGGMAIDIRCFDYAKAGAPNDPRFHDRYLFVDDALFMIGTSLSSHVSREYCTAVVRIDDHNGRALLKDRFLDCWNKAEPI